MSTNGLLLNDKADEVIDVGIDSLTVTVNAVDPEIEAMINARIFYHGKTYTGVEAAEILIHNQLEGIRKVAKSGTLIKVNTVLWALRIFLLRHQRHLRLRRSRRECSSTYSSIAPIAVPTPLASRAFTMSARKSTWTVSV